MRGSVKPTATAMIPILRKADAMMKLKYKGRTFTNGRSLANAMTRDLNQEVERKLRQAASSSGLRVRKTHKGLEVEGDAANMDRFYKRLGR